MSSIYQCAYITYIFLGPSRSEKESYQIETVMTIFERLGTMARDWNLSTRKSDILEYHRIAKALLKTPNTAPDPIMSKHESVVRQIASDLVCLRDFGSGPLPFELLLERPWWQRVWVSCYSRLSTLLLMLLLVVCVTRALIFIVPSVYM